MGKGSAVGAGRSAAIVLFTDLVGSTELRSRLGEDAAERLRHQHDALVAGAVEASGGNVVKNLGDGIMATFGGASDAVGAAVAIQQAIGRHNRSSAAARLEIRIGISAGDVVFEGDDCFGTPVIEAARLCGAAAGGQILASETVRWLARSGEGTFTPVGSLELRGLPEPVPAVQVDWGPLPQSSVPLPAFLTDIGRIFVGRDDELERGAAMRIWGCRISPSWRPPAPLRSDPEVAAWLAAASVDLQWAAKPTLLLLRHVVRAAGGRVLVLCTYRDTELTHDHPLVEFGADLRRQGGVERLSLSGLDDVGVAAFVEQASGRQLDEAGLALARAVSEETEGNPFFVREVLRHLAETGAIEQGEGGWATRLPVDQLGIPEGVREVVGHRLSRMGGATAGLANIERRAVELLSAE